MSHIDGGVTDESLTEVVFQVDDVKETYSLLAERGVPFEIELSNHEQRQLLAAHFRDPDGHYGSRTGWVDTD